MIDEVLFMSELISVIENDSDTMDAEEIRDALLQLGFATNKDIENFNEESKRLECLIEIAENVQSTFNTRKPILSSYIYSFYNVRQKH